MATATESDIKPKFSDTFLATYKGKETCPCCEKKLLYTNDSEKFDDIMHYTCLGCGYTFDENNQQKKWRKEQKKGDKSKNSASQFFLLLFGMLAIILVINLNAEREAINQTQRISFETIGQQDAEITEIN